MSTYDQSKLSNGNILRTAFVRLSDSSLVATLRESPGMNSEELSMQIYQWAYSAAKQVLGTKSADAEDVAQETWLAIERRRNHRPGDLVHLERLVRRAAINEAIDLLRKSRVCSLDVELPASDPIKKVVADKIKCFAKQVWECLETPERDLVVMRAYEDLAFGQIADRIERPRSSISSMFQRLPKKIEKRLRQRGMQ